MKKIMSARKIDPAEIHENLKNGFGIEHPEKINGYVGFFVNYGDVFASDDVSWRMEHNKDFNDFVVQSIRDFKNDSYGMISDSDYYLNVEGKWIAGGDNLFGRYPFGAFRKYDEYEMPGEYIKVRYYEGKTYVMFDSELDSVCINTA